VTEGERLHWGTIAAYSLPSVAIGFTGLLFSLYLMKYATDVLLLSPAMMGSLLMISRIWDGVSDPLAGHLSDRTRSRFGRRRSWMFAAAIPMGGTFAMMWSPPEGMDGTALVLWMAVALLLYETASTAFFVPHGALGVELSQDYHERTRLFGYRHMISFAGVILGLGGFWLVQNAEDERGAVARISLLGGVVVALVILWTTARLPERAEYQGRAGSPLLPALRDIGRNPHARLLLVVFGIETFGTASIATLVPYMTEYVLHVPGSAVTIIACYFTPQALLAPLWIRVSRRFGKRNVWAVSMAGTMVAFGGLFFASEDSLWLVHLLPALLGAAAGCGAVVAPSIKADVIDYDELMTGERKEGAYLAVWNFIRKAAGGVAAGLTGYALTVTGFVPGQEQTEAVIFTLRSLFSWFPALCYGFGTVLVLRFAFNEAEHAAARATLARRRPE